MTCGGSFPSDRFACFPAAATASSTASRGTNAASTPRDTQSVSRPSATKPLSAIGRDHAGYQAEHHGATHPRNQDQLRLSGIASGPLVSETTPIATWYMSKAQAAPA